MHNCTLARVHASETAGLQCGLVIDGRAKIRRSFRARHRFQDCKGHMQPEMPAAGRHPDVPTMPLIKDTDRQRGFESTVTGHRTSLVCVSGKQADRHQLDRYSSVMPPGRLRLDQYPPPAPGPPPRMRSRIPSRFAASPDSSSSRSPAFRAARALAICVGALATCSR